MGTRVFCTAESCEYAWRMKMERLKSFNRYGPVDNGPRKVFLFEQIPPTGVERPMDFESIDPYFAIVAAAKGVPYSEIDKNENLKERTEAKIWFIKRTAPDFWIDPPLLSNWTNVPESERRALVNRLRHHLSSSTDNAEREAITSAINVLEAKVETP
jgi:hypothetical protein